MTREDESAAGSPAVERAPKRCHQTHCLALTLDKQENSCHIQNICSIRRKEIAMPEADFISIVRKLMPHERATLASNGIKWETTMVLTSLKRLEELLQGHPDDAELEVYRKKDRYVLRIRRWIELPPEGQMSVWDD
jgi:hypothetical protein